MNLNYYRREAAMQLHLPLEPGEIWVEKGSGQVQFSAERFREVLEYVETLEDSLRASEFDFERAQEFERIFIAVLDDVISKLLSSGSAQLRESLVELKELWGARIRERVADDKLTALHAERFDKVFAQISKIVIVAQRGAAF